jgi:transcriptional regulator with PAS, ATPase and Fis domain
LRERKNDIALLTDYFLIKYSQKNKKNVRGLSPQALNALSNYKWPGNVRELENVIERSVIVSKTEFIELNDLPSSLTQYIKETGKINISIPYGTTLKEAEKKIILETLQSANDNKAKTARVLGISTRKIEYKIKEWSKN